MTLTRHQHSSAASSTTCFYCPKELLGTSQVKAQNMAATSSCYYSGALETSSETTEQKQSLFPPPDTIVRTTIPVTTNQYF